MNSYRTVTKIATPGTSKNLDYVVNIFYNGRFKFAYRFRDWSEEAVDKEVVFIRKRFSDSDGFLVKW